MVRKPLVLMLAIALTLTSFGGAAHAATIELSTAQNRLGPSDNQGWWSATEANQVFNDNYFVGIRLGNEIRNFFTFDVRSIPEELTVVRATLHVPVGFSDAGDAFERIAWYRVKTDAVALNNNDGTNAAIFDDLGTGQRYGTFDVQRGLGAGTDVPFRLNSAAVADINASRTAAGYFSVGGALVSLSGLQDEFLFGGSGDLAAHLTVIAWPIPREAADCKFNGWRHLSDERGHPFASQRACLDYVAAH